MNLNANKRAIVWSGIEKCGTYVVNFALQVILARLLCPEDYAVVAMLSFFFSLSQAIIDGGFCTSLIQKQGCTKEDFNSVFFFNFFVSFLLYVILWIAAPSIEYFYGFCGLAKVTRIYALTLVINSLCMTSRVILMKKLEFRKLAYVLLAATIISAVPTVYLAQKGYGYWALVAQQLVSSTVTAILTIAAARWKPSGLINASSIKTLFPFGIRVMFVSILYAAYNNLYSLVIGKKFAARELGLFDRGKSIGSMGPIGFSDFYMRALFPIQSKIQGDDSALSLSYSRSFRLISLIIVPVSVFVSVFASDVITFLYGNNWTQSASLLVWLAPGFMLYPFNQLNINMLKVKGKGDFLLQSELLKKAIGIIVVLILASVSLKAVVMGWLVVCISEFIISEVFYYRLCRFAVWKDVFFLIICVVMCALIALSIRLLTKGTIDNLYVRTIISGFAFVGIILVFFHKKIKSLWMM